MLRGWDYCAYGRSRVPTHYAGGSLLLCKLTGCFMWSGGALPWEEFDAGKPEKFPDYDSNRQYLVATGGSDTLIDVRKDSRLI